MGTEFYQIKVILSYQTEFIELLWNGPARDMSSIQLILVIQYKQLWTCSSIWV